MNEKISEICRTLRSGYWLRAVRSQGLLWNRQHGSDVIWLLNQDHRSTSWKMRMHPLIKKVRCFQRSPLCPNLNLSILVLHLIIYSLLRLIVSSSIDAILGISYTDMSPPVVSDSKSPMEDINMRQYSVQALVILAELIASLLDVIYSSEEKDKVVPFLNSIMPNVFPYLRNHRCIYVFKYLKTFYYIYSIHSLGLLIFWMG